jgi:ubiquitin C-terminal hydrolase
MFKCPFNYYFSRFISKIYSYPEEQDKQFYQTFDIDDFRNLLVKKNKIFQGSSTKDAEKFLVFFLQILHEELNQFINTKNKDIEKNSNFKEYYKELLEKNNSIIFDCFTWIQKKKITCTVNHSFIEFQNFFTYQLNIKSYIERSKKIFDNTIKLSDLIKFDLTLALLYNINCIICKKKIKDDVTNFISISPNYFIFLTGLRDEKKTLEKFTLKKENDSKERYKFIIEKEINLGNIINSKPNDFTPDLIYTTQNSHKIYQLDALIGYNFDEQDEKKISYIAYYRCYIDYCWYLYSHKEFKKIDEKIVQKTFEDSLFPSILIYSHK